MGVAPTGFKRAGQEPDKVVEKLEFANAPVTVAAVKVKKGLVEAGKKFSDDEDWLKYLTVRVKNISGKRVNYVSVLVVFTRPKNQDDSKEAPFGDSLRYGNSTFSNPPSAGRAPAILPSETVYLTWDEHSYEVNLSVLQRLKYPKSLKKVEIYVEEVGFEDGTVWSGGLFFRRDPNNPKKLIPAE